MAVEIKKVVLEAEVEWVHITTAWCYLITLVSITFFVFGITTKLIKFCIANQHDQQLIWIILLCVAWVNMLLIRMALSNLKKRSNLALVRVDVV